MNTPSGEDPVSRLRLWVAALMPVIAWALHLFASYAFVEWYCRNAAQHDAGVAAIGLNTIFVFAFLVAVTGSVMCFRNRKLIMQSTVKAGQPASGRGLFVATVGLFLGLFMVTVILVQWLPGLMVPPCL